MHCIFYNIKWILIKNKIIKLFKLLSLVYIIEFYIFYSKY